MADLFISPAALAARLHRADAPAILDLRDATDAVADPRVIPGAEQVPLDALDRWPRPCGPVVVTCQKGGKLSQLAAGLLRTDGLDARTMRGGHLAWVAAGHPVCRVSLRKRRWVIPLDTNWAELASLWVLLRLLDRAAQVQAIERSWCAAAAEVWTASVLPATPGALAEAAGLEHPLVARLLGGPEELLAGRLARMSQPTAALDLIDDWIARPEGAA